MELRGPKELASAELAYFAAETYMSGGFAVEALALIQAYRARESDTASNITKLSILEGRALAAVAKWSSISGGGFGRGQAPSVSCLPKPPTMASRSRRRRSVAGGRPRR